MFSDPVSLWSKFSYLMSRNTDVSTSEHISYILLLNNRKVDDAIDSLNTRTGHVYAVST